MNPYYGLDTIFLLTIDTLIIITTFEKSVIVITIFRGEETMTMIDYTILTVTQLPFISGNKSVSHFLFNFFGNKITVVSY